MCPPIADGLLWSSSTPCAVAPHVAIGPIAVWRVRTRFHAGACLRGKYFHMLLYVRILGGFVKVRNGAQLEDME